MEEAQLKEILSKLSGKSFTPSFSNDISGWIDEPARPKKISIKNQSKIKTRTLLTAQKIYLKRPTMQLSKIKKPPSLFQFNFFNRNSVKFKKSPKKLVTTNSRPSSSIKRPNSKDGSRYAEIMMNKTIVFESNLLSTRNYYPHQVKKKGFRRSASNVEDFSKMTGSELIVKGSCCNLKLIN